MKNRLQTVDINNVKSNGTNLKIGVPQGSILGPFLFLAYVNDLPCMVEREAGIVLFADDTSLIFKMDR
ncbi:reverse transcriptase domain-containing protein, partial [Proteus faecis]|uniref:reverse transcriptase domain-containing protein n=1 Tax=Proteus faecis TaxID=2050967 RepID=UPI00301C7F22